MFRFGLAATVVAPLAANAAEVRVVPGDSIVLNPANGRGYSDLVIHAVAIRADDGERLTIDDMRIDLLEKGRVVLSEHVDGGQLARETAELSGAPLPAFVTGQLLDQRGLDGLFAKPTKFARGAVVEPGQAVLTARHYFATRAKVDAVRISVTGHNTTRSHISAERLVPVTLYNSPIEYRAPLKGVWLMQAIPTLQSHHRLNPSTEFAVDFFKIDDSGKGYRNDELVAANWYGYGADVLAAADGDVVRVIDGEVQDRAALSRRADETPQAAGERIGTFNMARMRRDFGRAAAGNLIILRHERGGVVEYSSYGHLRSGIALKVGDHVRQGQVIGKVGDTGDSAAVHLHFQVNAGPDPFTSKSLPARLQGLRPAGGNAELGRMVTAG